MYEISLVPDVKSELLQKQKLRNFIIFICIIIAGACATIILLMLGVTGTQALTIGGQEKEISCRTDGTVPKGASGSCSSEYGTPVMTFKNVDELLTIQDQMKNISVLNQNKIKFSRIFGLLDVLLPDGSSNGDRVDINELSADVSQNLLSFDAVGHAGNNIGYHSLETFRKGAAKTYFDYGSYMRKDSETGDYIEIPAFCITETRDKDGYVYGTYHKGAAGCEKPMVVKKDSEETNEENNEQTNEDSDSDESTEDTEKPAEEKEEDEVKEIKIRRTYDNSKDREEYKNGNDSKAGDKEDKLSGYYFESKCLQYKDDENGSFDEEATLAECPVLVEDGLLVNNSAYGRDGEDNMVLSFSAALTLDPRVFLTANKHMLIFGPSHQNVTDSYVQIRDMFTAKARSLEEGGE